MATSEGLSLALLLCVKDRTMGELDVSSLSEHLVSAQRHCHDRLVD